MMNGAEAPSVRATAEERFLVTGALGCIGAWALSVLVREGVPVVAFDLASDRKRLRLVMSPEEQEQVTFVRGDITDLASIEEALDAYSITNVIHLAALQIPFARADPPLGALVNVVGTVNVLEAVKRRADRMAPLVYTSSIAIFDAADADVRDGRLHVDATAHPQSHYGVYKLANEGNARVYWLENGLSSVGLRPMTVYGPGRDQGLTSGPTKAILSAVVGRPYRIPFGGRMLFQYAEDVARTLVAASRSRLRGAHVLNIGGSLASIDELIDAIDDAVPGARTTISHDPEPLPFPAEIDDAGIELIGAPVTPLRDAVAQTVAIFGNRYAAGELDPAAHGLEPLAATV